MSDGKSEFKYYKLDSCYLLSLYSYLLLKDSDLEWSGILILLILYCCIIKFPQVLQLQTEHIYFLTELPKVDHPGVVLQGQRGLAGFLWKVQSGCWLGWGLQSGLVGPAHLCQAHRGLLAGGLISLPQCGPCSIGPQGCSQHAAHFPPSKGREKERARKTSRPTQPSIASAF